MSTDIATVSQSDPALPAPVADAGSWADRLVRWAEAADKAHRIALILCETSFVPRSMQHRPGEVTGAILTGMELDVPVMWALANIDLIDGTPALRAKALRALALRKGHRIWVEESTATRAIVCGQRKGSPHIEKSVWTLDRAKRAGLVTKTSWQRFGQDMLLNRGTAEVVRLIAPDVLIGAVVEELDGDQVETGDDAKPAADKPERKRRTKAPAAVPDVEPAALPADVPTPADQGDAERPDTNGPAPVDAPAEERPPVVSEAQAIATMEAAGFEVVDVIDTLGDADQGDGGMPPPRGAAEADQGDQPADDQSEAAAPAGDDLRLMTDPQRRRMGVEMRKANLIERQERLSFVADIIGREVMTANELTVAEASKVIQALVELSEEIEAGLAAAADQAQQQTPEGGDDHG